MKSIEEIKHRLLNIMATVDDMMSVPPYKVDWPVVEALMKKRDELL